MVLKLDHVSFSCGKEFEITNIIPNGYDKKFEEIDLQNIACKIPFLKRKCKTHNIFMYEGETDKSIPIEVTQYTDVVDYKTSIKLDGRRIMWPVVDTEAAKEFFVAVGGKADSDLPRVVFKPFLDKASFEIEFVEAKDNEMPFLDVEGFSSLGIFSDNAKKEMDKMSNKGYFVTEVSEIVVDGKKMDIGFVMGKNNEIVEFISVSKMQRGLL